LRPCRQGSRIINAPETRRPKPISSKKFAKIDPAATIVGLSIVDLSIARQLIVDLSIVSTAIDGYIYGAGSGA